MGVVLDVVVGLAERAMSFRDIPGFPSTPGLALDTMFGLTDEPSWEEVGKEVAKDGLDAAVPGSGPLLEAAGENFGESMDRTNERHDLMERIRTGSRDGNPYDPGE